MDDEDQPIAAGASAGGIMQCLRMLAEEAISLGLLQSADAILVAFNVCEEERLSIAHADGGAPLHTATLPPLH